MSITAVTWADGLADDSGGGQDGTLLDKSELNNQETDINASLTEVDTELNKKIAASITSAKGDLIAATAADTVDRLPIGADTSVLTADSATTTGMKWSAAGAAPTKEFFVPNSLRLNGGAASFAYQAKVGTWPVNTMDDSDAALFAFHIPNDFTALTDAVIVCIPDATETITWDLEVSVSAVGEDHDNDVTTVENDTKAVTVNDLTELDISTQMVNAAANDYVGVYFESDENDIRVIGLRIKYS